MPNIKSIVIKQNTSRFNSKDNKVDVKQCNCRSTKNCPLNEKCCRNSIIYKLFLKTVEMYKFYIDEVGEIVNGCRICAEIKLRFHKLIESHLIKATQPMERLSMEFKSPLLLYLRVKISIY